MLPGPLPAAKQPEAEEGCGEVRDEVAPDGVVRLPTVAPIESGGCKLYVGNLSFNTCKETLEQSFAKCALQFYILRRIFFHQLCAKGTGRYPMSLSHQTVRTPEGTAASAL